MSVTTNVAKSQVYCKEPTTIQRVIKVSRAEMLTTGSGDSVSSSPYLTTTDGSGYLAIGDICPKDNVISPTGILGQFEQSEEYLVEMRKVTMFGQESYHIEKATA